MRDIAVLIFVAGCIVVALRCAWHGVLTLAIFSYMNPHSYSWGFVRGFPAFQTLFFVVAFATLLTKDRQSLPKDWRLPMFILLWLYFFFTTTQAYHPELAWDKLWLVTKIYLPYAFTLLLINTREKTYYLIITVAASIGLIASKGGVFAITHGFSARVYGPNGTQFFDNNQFALAVLINVPLLVLWYRETKNKWVKMALMAAIPLSFASSLSSFSRGGFLTMVVVTIVLLWHSKRKYLAIPILIVGIFAAFHSLPDKWFGRMQTIETYEEDSSAMQRIEAWRDGWNHTLRHPLIGSGFDGWHYVTKREWHNSYVEIFAEHGFVAFAMWMSLILGTIVSLTRLPRLTKGIEGLEWVGNYCYMIRASIIAYMAGGTFLGLAYWDLLYHLIFISVLVKQFALKELSEYTAAQNSDDLKLSHKRSTSFIRKPNLSYGSVRHR